VTKVSKKFTAAFIFLAIIFISVTIPFKAQGEEDISCTWLQFQDQVGQTWLGCFVEGNPEPIETEPLLPPAIPPDDPVVIPPAEPPVKPPSKPTNPDKKPAKPGKKPVRPGPGGGVRPSKPTRPGSGGISPDIVAVRPDRLEPKPTIINQTPGPVTIDRVFGQINTNLNRGSVKALDFPLFLLPIYQACANEYNVDWEILASINKIETRFGELNYVTSSAGAQGWMQFMPSTWEMYGTDANRDGKASPYNPVDAICSAARYLQASGYEEDVYKAIFAYNRADWYVSDVLEGAKKYQQLPKDLVSALTSLTSPSFSPVKGAAYRRLKDSKLNAVIVTDKKSVGYVRAITDSKVEESGISKKFGRYIILKDQFGNRFLYGKLGKGALPKKAVDQEPAKITANRKRRAEALELKKSVKNISKEETKNVNKQNPSKKKRLAPGRVLAGQNIAKVNKNFVFAVRPAGAESPWIDPTILIDNWQELEEVAFAKLARKIDNKNPSLAQIFMMPRQALAEFIVNNQNLAISKCDQDYIVSGMIDRRILTLLGYLANKGYRLGISSLLCGRESSITVTGNASNHSFGRGVDIYEINGENVFGNQQPGSLTEEVVLEIFNLEGLMKPDELISLFNFGPPSWSDPVDHADHIHVGYSETSSGSFINTSLDKKEWDTILGTISKQKARKSKNTPNKNNPKRVIKEPGRQSR